MNHDRARHFVSTPERVHLAKVTAEAVESLAELSRRLPIQAIDPRAHKLIEEGPTRRQRFLDWDVFHVEHAFHAL